MKRKPFIFFIFFILLVVPAARADIAQVEEAIINQDYDLAKLLSEEILDFAVVDKKLSQQTRYYLALSQLRLGNEDEARKLFRGLIKKNLDQGLKDKSYLGLFEVYYQQENYKKALKTAKKMIDQSRGSTYRSLMHLKQARTYLKLAEWDEAREILQKIVRDYPDSFEAHTANQLLEEKQFFAVQVGAFLEQTRAEKLVEELNAKNEYAYIVETADRDERLFYRVRVGQNARLNDAQKLQVNLAKQGYPTQIYP